MAKFSQYRDEGLSQTHLFCRLIGGLLKGGIVYVPVSQFIVRLLLYPPVEVKLLPTVPSTKDVKYKEATYVRSLTNPLEFELYDKE